MIYLKKDMVRRITTCFDFRHERLAKSSQRDIVKVPLAKGNCQAVDKSHFNIIVTTDALKNTLPHTDLRRITVTTDSVYAARLYG